ncbi:MAG: 2-hydroxychromene-2-carboxylate isomerase [Marinibacterium sp.]|nr:2-hydroxychromene-2-carboxylate isomerase [Marinibacterium sp.]
MTHEISFWFDFASTYSYLSAMRIDGLARDRGVTVHWQPMLLGPIFHAQGWSNSPFNLYPAKGAYMWQDMARLCRARGLPFHRPDTFPAHSLLAARVALAALDHPQGPAFCRAVFAAQFAEGRDISDPDTLRGALSRADLPATLMDAAGTDAIKQRLRDQTDAARASGIFGAPSFVVGDALYWGDDRLDMALDTAAAAGPDTD